MSSTPRKDKHIRKALCYPSEPQAHLMRLWAFLQSFYRKVNQLNSVLHQTGVPNRSGIFLAGLPKGTREIFHLGQASMAGSLIDLPSPAFASVDWIPDSHTCAGPWPWLYLPGTEGRGPAGVPHRQLHQEGADRVCPLRH